MSLLNQKSYNGYVINPENGIIYLYDSTKPIEYTDPVMDARAWNSVSAGEGMGGKTASIQQDPLRLTDVFYDTQIPGIGKTAVELATDILQEANNAKRDKDLGRAASVITSKDMSAFQTLTVLGTTDSTITRQGILTGLFEEIPTPTLAGKWATFDDGIKFYTNVAEGTSVEPSGGTGSVIQIDVPKHEGAVAITYRAQQVINGDNPFSRLTARLQQEAAKKENGLVAAEIESNTAHTTAGVDFGARTGSPPESTTNPVDMINSIITYFSGLNKGQWDTFITKAFIFNEYVTNDIIRGSLNPIPTQTDVNEQSSPMPAAGGVLWVRDNAISSSTAGWALDRNNAIKVFRGPTTAYTVSNQDTETTKDVLRRYMQVETVDTDLVYYLTAIAA